MFFFRALTAAVAVLGMLTSGCSGADGELEADEALDLDNPLYSTMAGPGGSGGQNHLHPDWFHPNKPALNTSTKANLAVWNAADQKYRFANTVALNTLFATSAGREVIKYAVRCTLPVGEKVWDNSLGVDLAYPGQGLLTTTTAWTTSALASTAAEDLFACMAAHMNPLGEIVPINLSGMHVTNAPGFDPTPYAWEEALWTSTIIASPFGGYYYVINVWPLAGLQACAINQVDGLTSRVCPTSGGVCGLSVRTDLASACKEYLTGWKCDGKPAIRTRLKVSDVPRMYKGCEI